MHRFCCTVTDWLYLSPENILNCFLTSWPRINLWHVALWRFFSLSMLVPHAGVSHVVEHWPIVSLDHEQVTTLPLFSSCNDSHTVLILLKQLISSKLILYPFHILILHYTTSPLSRYHCLPKKHLFWCNNTQILFAHQSNNYNSLCSIFDSQLTETHSSP